MTLRPLELRHSLDTLIGHTDFGPLIDTDKIGAFGYSQGGLSVLIALGAHADHHRIIKHCQTHTIEDLEFCSAKSTPILQRLRLMADQFMYTPPRIDPDQTLSDPRIKTAVIAAPVGAAIVDLSEVTRPIWIIRAGNDDVLNFPFHAEAIHKKLKTPHKYSTLAEIEHYAFLSPFPDRIKTEVGAPAKDPPNFDRLAFLNQINAEITAYFHAAFTP